MTFRFSSFTARAFQTATRFRAPLLRAAKVVTATATATASVSALSLLALPIVQASTPASASAAATAPIKNGDYTAVRKAIADILEDPNFDDGSLGPLFVRLAWHASGTYSTFDKTGGSNGGTMRFKPESTDGANAGLDVARNKLAAIHQARFPWMSHGDVWTLAGVVAIEEMGGPTIKWTPGRVDVTEKQTDKVPPNGRLPDADKAHDHIRAIFYRMGFNDREIVALLGAHTLGRCHPNRSGFDGPWTRSPVTFSNEFFRVLFEEKWVPVTLPNGVKQFRNGSAKGDLMMLPADLAIRDDAGFRKWAELYAKDEATFSKDFAAAFSKMLQLGVPEKKGWF